MISTRFGVSGCGKSAIGAALAKELGWPYFDADDFHPKANIEKMHRGIPLNDEDRYPWLEILKHFEEEELAKGEDMVLGCSALKQSYRDILTIGEHDVVFVYLKGSKELIYGRMRERKGHFFDPSLLNSQFETFEEPTSGIAVDISGSISSSVAEIKSQLKL